MTLEERVSLAQDNFKSGLNCCQSVVLAFKDLTSLDEGSLKSLSLGFGGGFGRMREVCGAVSGMTILVGFLTSDKKEAYALVQHFANRYRELNGSIVCRDLLGLAPGENATPTPTPRTAGYYSKRPCGELVGMAARIVAEWLETHTTQ